MHNNANYSLWDSVMNKVDVFNITEPSVRDLRRNRFSLKKDICNIKHGLDSMNVSITSIKTIDGL